MIPGEFVLWDRIFPFKQESLLRQRTVPTRKIIKPVCCLEGLWIAEYGWKYCIDERKLGITLSGRSSRSQGKFLDTVDTVSGYGVCQDTVSGLFGLLPK
jgi:hypothetical protein